MADYIDRQALDVVAFTDRDGTFSDGIQWLLEYIDALPPADAVEVVRCKDCKHWDAFDIHSTICPNSRRCKGIIGKMYTAPDYYCAYGERKDG